MGLFKPAWQSDSKEKALRAVEKETDQIILTKIAGTAPLSATRQAAVEKLTDQLTLIDIAKKGSDIEVCIAAVKKLTDQSVLLDIVINCDNEAISMAAVEKITNQVVLANIAKEHYGTGAKNYSFGRVLIKAFDMLADHELIADVANNTFFKNVIQPSVYSLTNQIALTYLAKNADEVEMRVTAAKKITDNSMMVDVAINTHDIPIWDYLIHKIGDTIDNISLQLFANSAKQNCEDGKHYWVLVDSQVESDYGTTDNYVTSFTNYQYKCKFCDKTKVDRKKHL